jgi:hypothetical protein
MRGDGGSGGGGGTIRSGARQTSRIVRMDRVHSVQLLHLRRRPEQVLVLRRSAQGTEARVSGEHTIMLVRLSRHGGQGASDPERAEALREIVVIEQQRGSVDLRWSADHLLRVESCVLFGEGAIHEKVTG